MSSQFFERGGGWVMLQAVLIFGVIGLGWIFRSPGHDVALVVIGAGLMVIAAVAGIAGWGVMGRQLTPFPKPLPNARLVRSGIYSWVRHPLYTSVFVGAIGWTLMMRSWPALPVVLVLGLFFDAKARREERWLKKEFTEYADYSKSTWRFIPWVY